MATAIVIKGEARALKAGGAWIYDNEIDKVEGQYENGDIVSVNDFDGYFLGYGVINDNSKIRIRMLSRYRKEVIDDDFLYERVKNAWEYRKTVLGCADWSENATKHNHLETNLNCCRIIFGEADFLPGIVVDKYADLLVVESLSLGMDRLKETIISSLLKILDEDNIFVRGVYERSDAPVRKKEGMLPFKGCIYSREADDGSFRLNNGQFDPKVEIIENGVHYMVDVENGQKTGFFLDQKFNRLAIQKLCKGKKVLDCFTHMGTFALNAGIAGAKEVLGLDISEFAVSQARENARLNDLDDTVKFKCANVLDELPKMVLENEKFDVVILDPPAFTKSREATKNAIKGYREINIKGLKLVKDGGYFATCSCSHFMTQELFIKTVAEAAKSAHKRLRQIEARTQAMDHPILWSSDESYYLKFLIFQVVDEK